jgi:hypothetical protein
MRRRVLLVGAGAALALALGLALWLRAPRTGRAPSAGGAEGEAPASGSGAGGARSVGEAPAGPGGAKHVRRLSAEDRRRLGEQIAAARRAAREAAAKAAAGRGAPPPSDDVTVPLEQAGKPLQDALQESIGILAECYRQQPGGESVRNATALMTMTSDPELGTVIDTGAIRDADGRPLDAKLDQCMRDTIDSLALPPLGTGGKLELQYTFKLD